MLIGVDDDGTIVGTAKIEEERIQQVTSTYINPIASIKCSMIEMTSQGLLPVAVIEVRGTAKPHKVVHAIDKLQQNDVFVRHGSVVNKASPEEMFQMREISRIDEERRHYIRVAQTHLKLGNLEKAIESYTKAIEILPTVDILLMRAKLYEQQVGKNYDEHTDHIANLALKDIEDALKLSRSKFL